jgi:phosphoesterase RecJ-like protein
MKLIENNRIVYFVVTQEMFNRTEANEADIDTFINYGLQIETAEIVMFFVELKDGIKISLRSIPPIAINNLAKEFGGNGHKNAAGTRLTNVSLDTMIPKLLESARRYLVHS